MMKNNLCEFCYQPLKVPNRLSCKKDYLETHTVCNACDEAMKRDQTKEITGRIERWGATHKCRKCECPLPLSRARFCDACFIQETEDEFDIMATDDDTVEKRRKLEPIKCQGPCQKTKVPNDFHVTRRTTTGRHPVCKECRHIVSKIQYWKTKNEVKRAG